MFIVSRGLRIIRFRVRLFGLGEMEGRREFAILWAEDEGLVEAGEVVEMVKMVME